MKFSDKIELAGFLARWALENPQAKTNVLSVIGFLINSGEDAEDLKGEIDSLRELNQRIIDDNRALGELVAELTEKGWKEGVEK